MSRTASATADLAARRVLAGMWRLFGQPPVGDALDTDALRKLIVDLRPVADDLSTEIMQRLGSDAEHVTVEMRVFIPGNEVGSTARSLRAINLAWRIAKLIAEPGEALPAASVVNLDELVSSEADGLQFASVEVGSLNVSFKGVRAHAKRLSCFAAMLPAMCGVSGYTVKDAVHAIGTTTSGQPCQIQIDRRTNARSELVIRQQIGTLASGSVIDIEMVTPDSAKITIHVPVGGPSPGTPAR